MDRMGNKGMQQLTSHIESVIEMAQKGESANNAIEKIARDNNLSVNEIDRIAQGFNKAKAVYYLTKTASDDRANSFDLADSRVIASKIFSKQEKTASLTLPGDLTYQPVVSANIEKVASFVEERECKSMTAASVYGKLKQHSDFMEKMQKVAHSDIRNEERNVEQALGRIADSCSVLSDNELQKVARSVVNEYDKTGDLLMQAVGSIINRPIGKLQKTANAVMFPAGEPYLSIQDAVQSSMRLSGLKAKQSLIEKEANAGILTLTNFLGNAAANELKDADGNARKDASDVLSPEHYNELKALESKRLLFSYVDDLADEGHSLNNIVGAWNNVSATHPDLVKKRPDAALTLMRENLETDGRRDIHDIAAAAKIEKDTPTGGLA